jgi:hypothetical protein
MREYTVEQSSLNFKWSFERMLPSLPGPGSPAFAELCKGLQPYDMTPSRVTVDSPSTRLGDLFVAIALLDNRLTIRFTSAGLELFVSELLVRDEEKLIPITDLVFKALVTIDEDAVKGKASFRAYSHLKIAPGEPDVILREHTKFPDTVPAFVPDAAVYKVDLGQDSKAQDLRVGIAKSLAYADAVFVDISAEYDGPINPAALAEQMNTDSERIIEMLGLRERVEPI